MSIARRQQNTGIKEQMITIIGIFPTSKHGMAKQSEIGVLRGPRRK